MPQSPQLDYAPQLPTPWHKRRRLRRWIVLVVLFTTVVSTGVHWGPQSWEQAQLYRAQRQCLNYVAPQGQLIYTTAPGDPFARNEANAFRQPPPACWVTLGSKLPNPEAFPKNAEPGFDGPFDELAPTPVFLHSCKSGGRKRLVVVQFGEQTLGGKWHRVLCCRVVDPATLFRGPALLWEQSTIIVSSFEWSAIVKVFAGVADQSDSSHFVIKFAVDDQLKVIDGWLQSDDTVKMQMRDDPPTLPL